MSEEEKKILEFLEQSYNGSKDESCQVRLARAIAIFKVNPEVSAWNLFTDKFITGLY